MTPASDLLREPRTRLTSAQLWCRIGAMGRYLKLCGLCLCCLVLAVFATNALAGGSPYVIRVCLIPPELKGKGTGNGWFYDPNGGGVRTGLKREEMQKLNTSQVLYIYDPDAPADNTKFLPVKYAKLPCDPKPPKAAAPATPSAKPSATPAPPAGVVVQGEAPKPADKPPAAAEKREKKEDAAGPPMMFFVNKPPPPEPVPPLPPGGVTEHWPQSVLPFVKRVPEAEPHVLPADGVTAKWPDHVLPNKGESTGSGDGSGDGTSKVATGKEPKKTEPERVLEELVYAGAILNGQLNEDTHSPDGKRYGILGGKNPDGPNHPAAQAAAGAVLVATAVVSLKADTFKKKLVNLYEAAIKKAAAEKVEMKVAALTMTEMTDLGKDAAEELAKKCGYGITDALHSNGAIGPYEVMQKFTKELGGRWQAHHILEESMMKKWKLGTPDLGPSVVLTDAEHKAITARLKAAGTQEAKNIQKLWKAYQEAYVDHPDWLEAIKKYFFKGK